MSIIVRTRPPGERRDWTSAPWVNGTTVPTPLQSASANYAYRTDDAFKVAAVVACVGMRAGAFAQLPIKAYSEGGSQGVLMSPQPELFVQPSLVSSVVPSVWKTQMSISRDVWGYAAGQIRGVDAAGYPSKVDWICPDIVDGHVEYVGGPIIWRFNNQEIDSSLVYHVPSRWVTPGNPKGMAPLEKSGLVGLAKMAQDFGRDWFLNGGIPAQVIYSDDPTLNETQAEGIIARFLMKVRSRRPIFLGSGLKLEQVAVAANESQFLETMRQAASDIAISFNLPPERINAAIGSKNEYSNIDMNQQQYLLDSINPDLVVIQEVMTTHMAPESYARWITAAFLRADLKTRYESYQIGLVSGFLDVDEVRSWEELPPMPPKSGGMLDAKGLADAAQRLTNAVGTVVTADEARGLLNREGAALVGSMPETAAPPAQIPVGGADVQAN